MNGLKPWFQKQLQPLAQSLSSMPPDLLTWAATGVSLIAAGLLYYSYERPALAVLAVPFIMCRLMINAVDEMVAQQGTKAKTGAFVISELSDRLSDVAIFLSLAFWPESKVHLVLLAIIAMLIVSYVGLLGKAAGAERIQNGLLGKGDRMVLLMVACLFYGLLPNLTFMGFSIFEGMFVLFIPLASITLLQRLDRIFAALSEHGKDR